MCAKIYCLLCFLIIILTISGYTQTEINFWDEVQQQCTQRCPSQNRTDAHSECGYDCKIEQCNQGCRLWDSALESSCKTVCNGTQDIIPPKELNCLMSCNYAMTRYFALIKERIGIPPAPALVADSLTATSLSLKWDFGGIQYAGVRYLVQWRYEELSDEWQYCRNQTWGTQDTVFVDNLQPYTKYRFRVALLLSQHHDVEFIVSESSVVISTLPSGTPTSAPSIVRAVPVDWSRISVSWEPGPFPHGPVLSYVLRINENHPHGYSALKDIPASINNYMFQNLAPSRNYNVTVAMRNGVGEGPAASILVSTPDEPEVKDIRKPILILGAHHTVIQQGADMLDEPIVLYKTKESITGLAIHVRKELLFISDSAGYIYKTGLKPKANRTVILSPQNLKFQPLDLSVDWLNEQLYILGEVSHSSKSKVWQITRCGLDGTGLTVAVAGLMTKPHHIEVDPYNGYLFWVLDGSSRAGLYRLDLADISNGIKHEVRPDIILERPHLGAFTVDHTKFRLLVPNHSNNTVYSVSFDGLDVDDIRENTQQPMFHNVLSLATANHLFYWTNGDEVLIEEYHAGHDNYYHNAYPDLSGRSYMTVAVNLPSCQPIPVPVNPPTTVQAILGSTLAKTSWQVPHLLGGQGKGAWQNWSYEINIKDVSHSKTLIHKGINTTSYTIHDLKENREYIIKTAAYTSAGTGPWSSEFIGRTLKRPVDERYPSIIWSASEGLLTSDVTGENVQTLIHKDNMKDYYITDIAWYQDQLYLVSNTSNMYWFNMTSHQHGKLIDVDSVGSVAVDWIGKKLYWSNPKQQLIIRDNLNGTQPEPLPISTVAKELNIDSINAYIYWSTGHAVECARLNGVDKLVYYPAELFSGKQVMGLTLDNEQETVYWIVRSYEGSILYRQRMAHHLSPRINPPLDRVTNLQKSNMQGPLCYFSDHLLWLQDDKNAVIADMSGQNAAVINGMSLFGLTMVSILDPQLHGWPYKQNKIINVSPDSILPESVKVIGNSDLFNITWLPTNNTNYGKLYYEIFIFNDINKTDIIRNTTDPYIRYWKHIQPYTLLEVGIRAYTYWSSAKQVLIKIYSPSSTPSAPENPRCFITYQRRPLENDMITGIFRWNMPKNKNGKILGYKIKCWYFNGTDNVDVCDNIVTTQLQHFIRNLTINEFYYFQVLAYTEIGNGNYSEVVTCDTNYEQPMPLLLAASANSIYIRDFDTHEDYSILCNAIQTIDLTYIKNENKIFWLNDLQELYMADINTLARNKLISLNGQGNSLTVDWVERCLYFVQNNHLRSGSSVYKLDLNKILKTEHVLTRKLPISSIAVSPFTRSLYWMETNAFQKNILMQATTDGRNIKLLFERNRHSFKRVTNNEYLPCNCPEHDSVASKFVMDHSDILNGPQIIFLDSKTNELISADKHGCDCTPIIDKNLINNSFPWNEMAVDKNKIYWSNSTNGFVYYMNRNSVEIQVEKMNRSRFMIMGAHTQPFPITKCLQPRQTFQQVSFHSKTADSITIIMPPVLKYEGCNDISIATVNYTIYYKSYTEGDILECDDTCDSLTTFDKLVTITGLRPFSEYMFSVVLKNYYSRSIQGFDEIIGAAVVFQTAAGAPTKPQNVTATVLNPTIVEVKWLPPEELNGKTVSYEIHWQTEIYGVRKKEEQIVFEETSSILTSGNTIDSSSEIFKTALLQNLSPNSTYLIWVRAYSENNETFCDSDNTEIKTYSEPSDIILVNSTAYSLNIKWTISTYIEHCIIQYAYITSNQWMNISNGFETNFNNIVIHELKPKMQYKFRLALKYVQYPETFIWPSDTRFIFETLGDRPTPPGTPIIFPVNKVYQITWETSRDNGARIEMYNLEGLAYRSYRGKRNTNRTAWLRNNIFNEDLLEDEWVTYYNGTDTYWIISGLNTQYRYTFRVSALNAYGWSDPSERSSEYSRDSAAMAEKQEQLGVILGISVPLFATVCVFVIVISVCFIRRKDNPKNKQQAAFANRPVNPVDVELATLRELPRRIHHNINSLYTAGIPEELTSLPQIEQDQVKLVKFLGSGAFGEVYEGEAKRLGINGADLKVAVKTLRKGTSEQEKIEFLQEAQHMSHFKHEHILQLLGVCLDRHFIIMELMEGGDLLTYLRACRKTATAPEQLTILDLMSMCVDVAKGCRYLEEMHFVHRDLACRNCLVSSSDRQSRVVKIGDFGLARDIYKNDYYRKEGEGLLPVRWMAPESLVDGVFTCQSDVWAFGVLMWEIMTIGEQPYQARNNLEVLHYVKGGGRLEKPTNSPEELHLLMMKCWSYQPENRPMFKYCLETLEDIYNSTIDGPLTAAHSGNYISTVPNGSSWKTETGDETTRDQVPLVPQTNYKRTSNGQIANRNQQPIEIPKYLEIINDNSDPQPQHPSFGHDGYEIPRSSIRSCKSLRGEDRSRTFSTSSTISNGSVSSLKNHSELCSGGKNGIQKTITQSLKAATKVQSANVEKGISYSNLTTQPLLESLGSEDLDCSVHTNNNLTQIVC